MRRSCGRQMKPLQALPSTNVEEEQSGAETSLTTLANRRGRPRRKRRGPLPQKSSPKTRHKRPAKRGHESPPRKDSDMTPPAITRVGPSKKQKLDCTASMSRESNNEIAQLKAHLRALHHAKEEPSTSSQADNDKRQIEVAQDRLATLQRGVPTPVSSKPRILQDKILRVPLVRIIQGNRTTKSNVTGPSTTTGIKLVTISDSP